MSDKLTICLLNEKAKMPERQGHSVGYDMFAYGAHTLSPNETKLIPVGFSLVLPEGCVARICDRSSMGLKGITTLGGIVDWSYRGQVGVILHSFAPEIFKIDHGQKIAQFLIQKCELLEIEVVSVDDYNLIPSERGAAGFGVSDGQRTVEEAKQLFDTNSINAHIDREILKQYPSQPLGVVDSKTEEDEPQWK